MSHFTPEQVAERLDGKKIYIATPCFAAMLYLNYAASMQKTMMLLRDAGVSFQWPLGGGDSLVTRARNNILSWFLQTDCTHLMFIDADIGWDERDIVKFLLADVDIVGGIYPKKCYPLEWPMNWNKGQSLEFEPDFNFIAARDLPTGFMMIRRNVIEAMIAAHPEWECSFDPSRPEVKGHALFEAIIDTDGIYLSEDFAFCRRAQQLGFKTWCDPTVTLSHMGNHMFRGGCIGDAMFPLPELKIEGWMSEAELKWLRTAASEMTTIAEIGCWKGRSTYALASMCKGTVYAVDHWQGSPEDLDTHHAEAKGPGDTVFKEFEANVGKFDNIEILRGDSVEMAAKSPTVDMVFIDGSHEYEAAKADILAWKNKATKLICGHDLDRPGVRKAVAEVFGARVGLATGTIWQVWL